MIYLKCPMFKSIGSEILFVDCIFCENYNIEGNFPMGSWNGHCGVGEGGTLIVVGDFPEEE